MNSLRVRLVATLLFFAALIPATGLASVKGEKRSRSDSVEDLAGLKNKQVQSIAPSAHRDVPKWDLESIRRDLLREFSGNRVGTDLILEFRGQRIPLQTALYGPWKLEVSVEGKAGASGNACYEMSLDLLNKKGWVKKISSAHRNCPFSGDKQGSLLLEFTDQLAQLFSLQEVGLFDQSEYWDKETGMTFDLRFLRTILKGEGWYESRGYRPHQDQAYRAAVLKFRNFSIAELRGRLDQLKSQDLRELQRAFLTEHWDELYVAHGHFVDSVVDLHTDYFSKIKSRSELLTSKLSLFNSSGAASSPNSDQLHTFLSWLWENDRKTYIEVISLLFPAQDGLGIDLELGTFDLFPDETVFTKYY